MDFVPVLTDLVSLNDWLMQAMDGKRRLEDMPSEAARLFPTFFAASRMLSGKRGRFRKVFPLTCPSVLAYTE